jgi:hypothetical protein
LGFAVTAGLAGVVGVLDLVGAVVFDPVAAAAGVAGAVSVSGAVGVAVLVGAAGVSAASWGVRRPTGSFRGLAYPTSATLAATAAATATATIKPMRTHVSLRFIATKRSRRGALRQRQSSPLPPP